MTGFWAGVLATLGALASLGVVGVFAYLAVLYWLTRP